jgi:hypothetical protein
VAQLKCEGVDSIFTEPLRTGWWTAGVKSLPASEKRRAGEVRRVVEISSRFSQK